MFEMEMIYNLLTKTANTFGTVQHMSKHPHPIIFHVLTHTASSQMHLAVRAGLHAIVLVPAWPEKKICFLPERGAVFFFF